MDDLIELKREFLINQVDDLEAALRIFLDSHPIFSALPKEDRDNAAQAGATRMLLAIRSASIVGLVR